MTREEILDGNKIIAKYMSYEYYGHNDPRLEHLMKDGRLHRYDAGWKRSPKANHMNQNNALLGLKDDAFLCRHTTSLRYHSSWDWLMPVVDKIEKTGQLLVFFELEPMGQKIVKFMSRPWHPFGSKDFTDTKLEATFKAVVELIKHVNLNLSEKTNE